jgi:hypothetical protein
MVDDIAVVRASYPEADVIFGRTYVINYGIGYGVYETVIYNYYNTLLGIGRSEEEAWYSASKVVQQLLLRKLSQ